MSCFLFTLYWLNWDKDPKPSLLCWNKADVSHQGDKCPLTYDSSSLSHSFSHSETTYEPRVILCSAPLCINVS